MIAWIKSLWLQFWRWWYWRRYTARGQALDSLAFLNAVSRRPWENDKRLRARVRESLRSSQTPLGIADAVAQHIPGIPYRVDNPGGHTVRLIFRAREADFDLAAIEAAIETVRPVWVRVIVEREDP